MGHNPCYELQVSGVPKVCTANRPLQHGAGAWRPAAREYFISLGEMHLQKVTLCLRSKD
jgi:hypothetical protein